MHLQDITSPIPFNQLLSDAELIKEVQSCLNVEQTGVVGPTTNYALRRFCFENRLNNFDTQLFGPTLANALLERKKSQNCPLPAATQDEAVFKKGLRFVLQWEGGFSNNPADLGGATNKGITWRTYNSYRDRQELPHQSVKQITDAEVHDIYKTLYWEVAGCNHLPPRLACCVFNWQVNTGRGIAFLQDCVGSKGDGQFGPKTLNDVQAYLKAHGEEALLGNYFERCEAAYRRWAVSAQNRFLKGWLRRLEALRQFLSSLDV